MSTYNIIFPWCFFIRLLASIYRFYKRLTRKTKQECNRMQKKRTDDNLNNALNNAKTLPDGIDDPDTDDWGQFVCIDDV